MRWRRSRPAGSAVVSLVRPGARHLPSNSGHEAGDTRQAASRPPSLSTSAGRRRLIVVGQLTRPGLDAYGGRESPTAGSKRNAIRTPAHPSQRAAHEKPRSRGASSHSGGGIEPQTRDREPPGNTGCCAPDRGVLAAPSRSRIERAARITTPIGAEPPARIRSTSGRRAEPDRQRQRASDAPRRRRASGRWPRP